MVTTSSCFQPCLKKHTTIEIKKFPLKLTLYKHLVLKMEVLEFDAIKFEIAP